MIIFEYMSNKFVKKDLTYLIEKLIETNELWNANYYLRSMKKAPHGGEFPIYEPNMFIKKYPFQTWLFINSSLNNIPCFLQLAVKKAKEIYNQCKDMDIEELLKYCFNVDNWWAAVRTLKLKNKEYNGYEAFFVWDILEKQKRYSDYFDFDLDVLLYVLILRLVEDKFISINTIEDIKNNEKLLVPTNKYGLTKLENIQFERQGFKLGDTYFLYNIFIDTSIGTAVSKCPFIFETINKIDNYNLYMRCDNNLAIPYINKLSTATVDCIKSHGATLSFSKIENIIAKQVTVHIHPKFGHKIVLIVKPDCRMAENFFHIEIEELWSPNYINDEIVMVNYIHSTYFPSKNTFTHIDFSVNQYDAQTYKDKYQEAVNETGIPIDKYADEHYKIWCVESDNISIDIWGKLVCATLSTPFRELFVETYKL